MQYPAIKRRDVAESAPLERVRPSTNYKIKKPGLSGLFYFVAGAGLEPATFGL